MHDINLIDYVPFVYLWLNRHLDFSMCVTKINLVVYDSSIGV